METCKKCEKYNKCKTLCKSREEYVNQDYGLQKEVPFSELDLDVNTIKNFDISPFGVTTNEKLLIYKMYFLDQRSIKDIEYHITYAKTAIYDFINNLKENIEKEEGIRKKEILTLHFKNLKKEGEIYNSLKLDPAYVHRTIFTYLDKYLI